MLLFYIIYIAIDDKIYFSKLLFIKENILLFIHTFIQIAISFNNKLCYKYLELLRICDV